MKDIFRPGEHKQKILDTRLSPKKDISVLANEKIVEIKKESVLNDANSSMKSSFVMTDNKKDFSAKYIIIIFVIIIFSLATFMVYYFFINKKNETINSDKVENQDQDLKRFEENIREIDSTSGNLDADKNDTELPVVDFNATL